jgi:translation initiation factor 1
MAPMARDRESRLVYSTGGETEKRKEEPAEGCEPAPGAVGIRLRLERRASGRVATVITGLPGPPEAAAALAKALKAACSTGGTFKNDVLELQGDHRARVEQWLAARGLASKRAGG